MIDAANRLGGNRGEPKSLCLCFYAVVGRGSSIRFDAARSSTVQGLRNHDAADNASAADHITALRARVRGTTAALAGLFASCTLPTECSFTPDFRQVRFG